MEQREEYAAGWRQKRIRIGACLVLSVLAACASQRAADLNTVAYDGRVKCGGYSEGALCLIGDAVVYAEEVTDAGVRVRHYSLPGTAEYMRVLQYPDGGTVALFRCMVDRWSNESSIPPDVLADNPAPETKGCVP